jgi:hypothetical protein
MRVFTPSLYIAVIMNKSHVIEPADPPRDKEQPRCNLNTGGIAVLKEGKY